MSFHTLVHGGLADRLHPRRRVVAERGQAQAVASVGEGGEGSMRGLEAIIALGSIAAAILIGLAR